MEIVNVEAIPIGIPSIPFRDSSGVRMGINAGEKRLARRILVIIRTNDDIAGVGEGVASTNFIGETMESIKYSVERYVRPRIMGLSIFDMGKILDISGRILYGNSSAKAALCSALYDAMGKTLNVPLYRLLGGKFRDKVLVGIEIGIKDTADMAKDAIDYVQRGIKVLKVKVGIGVKQDIENVRAIREAVGDTILLRADANQGFTTSEAIRFCKGVEKYELEYMEQPVARWDFGGMAQVRKATSIPIEADETVFSPHDAIKVVKMGAADVINLKPCKHGGIYVAKKIAAIAEAAGLTCMCGCMGGVGFEELCKVHLSCSTENARHAGEFTELVNMTDNMISKPHEIKNGFLEVPEAPGVGAELDENKLKKYTINL